MKKSKVLANAIAMALASASMAASAQNTTYVGNLTSTTYSKASATPIFSWDGHNNNVGGVGWGWGHNANFFVFNLTAPTAVDIKVSTATGGTNQANFNSGLTLWSTAGYIDPAPIGNGHTFSQVSTDSTAGNGTLPWLTDTAAGNVTGFVGYANSGPTGWTNAAGKIVNSGAELNGTGLVNTATVGNQNAELLTQILPAGQYLLAVGGSFACGSFLGNTGLPTCPAAGSGAFSLTIDQVVASSGPVREDNNGDKHADILWWHPGTSLIAGAGYGDAYELLSDVGLPVPTAPLTVSGGFAGVPIPSPWAPVGRGDYNGDGKSDILWGNSLNQLYISTRTSASPAAYNLGGQQVVGGCVPATSSVVGTGDFNGDNISDILLQNSSGNINLLLMNGIPPSNVDVTISNTAGCKATFATPPTPSSVVTGTGDYNGDGKADILWGNSAGQGDVQYTGVSGTTNLSGLSAVSGLVVEGSGNYDGDAGHKSDILLRNVITEEVSIKTDVQASPTTVGTPLSAPGLLANSKVSLIYKVRGTGDYDGDGKNDILWRDTTNGYNYLFLMNGATVRTSVSNFLPAPYDLIPVSLGWDIRYTQTQ